MLKRITTAACLCATAAQAHASTLSGTQISDLVAGATLAIDTPLGTKLPVRYTRDGRLSGEAGGLVSYLGTASDRGRWWVTSDLLCHKWNRWFGSEPQCIRLSREGRVIHWRSQDGYAGTATIAVPPAVMAEVARSRAHAPDGAGHAAPPEMPPAPAAASEAPASENGPAPPVKVASQPSPEPAAPPNVAAAPPVPAMVPPAKAPPAPQPVTAALPERMPPQPKPAQKLEPRPEPEPESARAAQPGFRVVNIRSDDVLNVRSGPSADFDIVGGLPPGSRGVVITSACRAAWCPVQHRSTTGWVNSAFLAPEERVSPLPRHSAPDRLGEAVAPPGLRDAPEALRTCLTVEARALVERIERQFGAVKVVSTCRPEALIAGTSHPSRHASGNAVDFLADTRKAAIVEWLIANHRDGGTMTYADMDHIHVDIGPHFVSIANGPRWLSWRDSARDFPHRQRSTRSN